MLSIVVKLQVPCDWCLQAMHTIEVTGTLAILGTILGQSTATLATRLQAAGWEIDDKVETAGGFKVCCPICKIKRPVTKLNGET